MCNVQRLVIIQDMLKTHTVKDASQQRIQIIDPQFLERSPAL